jgi:hypothetical protein
LEPGIVYKKIKEVKNPADSMTQQDPVITRWLFIFLTKTTLFWFIKRIGVDSVKTRDPSLGPSLKALFWFLFVLFEIINLSNWKCFSISSYFIFFIYQIWSTFFWLLLILFKIIFNIDCFYDFILLQFFFLSNLIHNLFIAMFFFYFSKFLKLIFF